MDFITNLLPSKYRNYIYNAILVVVNRYIKILYYILIIKKINAIKLTKLFFMEITLKFGILDSIIIDRGSIFTSTF